MSVSCLIQQRHLSIYKIYAESKYLTKSLNATLFSLISWQEIKQKGPMHYAWALLPE
jgi:hypothetical protein